MKELNAARDHILQHYDFTTKQPATADQGDNYRYNSPFAQSSSAYQSYQAHASSKHGSSYRQQQRAPRSDFEKKVKRKMRSLEGLSYISPLRSRLRNSKRFQGPTALLWRKCQRALSCMTAGERYSMADRRAVSEEIASLCHMVKWIEIHTCFSIEEAEKTGKMFTLRYIMGQLGLCKYIGYETTTDGEGVTKRVPGSEEKVIMEEWLADCMPLIEASWDEQRKDWTVEKEYGFCVSWRDSHV